MNDKLILVDEEDNTIGFEEKLNCHLGDGKRHRAFSVYILNNKNELLIQKRADDKLLWPGYWANSCCSHPRKGESRVDAAKRRLIEELGFTCDVKMLFKYKYQAKFKNVGSENEYNAVLFGIYNGEVKPNPSEVAEWKWVSLNWLKKDIINNKNKYAPWFLIALPNFFESLQEVKI